MLFADPSLGESQYRTVFVDPGTAEIRGDLPTYGSSGALPLRTWISNLHRSLNLGEPGRIYSELAASWLWVIALGGLLLWIDRIRRKRTDHKEHSHEATPRHRAGPGPCGCTEPPEPSCSRPSCSSPRPA